MRGLVTVALALAALAAGCRSTVLGNGVERPYQLVFEGNRGLSSKRLEELIQLDLRDYERSEWRKAYVDDAAYDLGVAFHDIGFPFAIVAYDIEGGQAGGPPERLRFTVTEGPRTVLQGAVFNGMEHLADANFERALTSKRTPFLQSSRPYYVEKDIFSALGAMEGDYVELGFLEAELVLASTDFNGDGTRARITVNVTEGPRFHVGKVEVLDAGSPPELLRICREVVERETEASERVFRQRTGYELRGQLIEALATRGYAEAKVKLSQDRREEEPLVDITLEIEAGPEIRVRDIRFSGNDDTREVFLRSRLQLEEGDVYDSVKVRESVRRLYETGLFSRVAIDIAEGEGPERELLVKLEESGTGEIFVEPGYGSYERARVTLGYRKRNLWGSGRLLRLDSTLAERAQRATVTLTDPWFLGSSLSADLSLRYDRRKLPSFTEEDLGSGIFWTHEWNAEHATTFGYQYRRSRATDIKVVDADVEEALSNLNISSVQAAQRMDTRDNFFLPSRGWFNEVTAELGDEALGSELDFLRTSLRLTTYGRLLPSTVIATGYRTGVIFPTARTEAIPIQERYFNGGQTTVRSFRFDELGPKDENGNPLGGEAFVTANVELRQDLSRRFQAAAFVDTGNVTPQFEDYFDFRDMELGIGVGLRYLLPIGPVRVDVGWNPDPEPGDPDYVVHFAVGLAF